MAKTALEVGDKVMYSKSFCQSIGAYTGEIPHARGTITDFVSLGSKRLAVIDWNNDAPGKVLDVNLSKVRN